MTKILKAISIFSFFFFIFYFLKDINLPFVGPFGNNNATYSIQAKNYLKFGLVQTKFAPVNKIENGKFQYYLHHPPLLQLLTAFSYKLSRAKSSRCSLVLSNFKFIRAGQVFLTSLGSVYSRAFIPALRKLGLLPCEYKVFGQNSWWPGRFFPILSTLTSIILMALVARQLWGEQEGWSTLFFASTCPFLFSFGKIIQFEPLLLCVTLLFTYFAIKNLSGKSIIPLILLTVVGCLIDWPMIIFLLVIYLVGITPKPYKFHIHVCIGFVVLTLFFAYASLLIGPKELILAYFGRGFGSELFGKTWAIPKLTLLLVLRIIIYFTPFGLLSAITFFLEKEKDKVCLLYLIFGGLNVLLFLNGAYAHPYWLYYLTPFFIFSLVHMFNKIISSKRWQWLGTILLITNTAFSILVIMFKDQQVKKTLWQDTFIDQVASITKPHQTIATSWDFNEELFRYKTSIPIKIYWSVDEITKDIIENPKFDYFIFSCWANCHPQEGFKIKEILGKKFRLVLREKEDRAVLYHLSYDLTRPALKSAPENISQATMQDSSRVKKLSEIIYIYRKVRDFLGVNQI